MLPGPTGPTGPTPVGPTGPLVPSMSAGHTNVPMPPGYVPTAEAQQNEIPKSQATWQHVETLRRLVEIILLQWAWLKSWFDLVVYGLKLRDGYHISEKFDIKFLAPTVVIVVGIVMTNALGFINFFLQGLHLDACMAAFDLDTPFLACKHGAQVVKGEDCPEWEKLRMRNSIWRSLPLAMITLILSLRNLVEIPTCQMFAAVGPLATSLLTDLENPSRFSRFIEDIHDDAKFNFYDIRQHQIFRETAAKSFTSQQRQAMTRMAWNLLGLESAAWDAAHCSDSTWEETMMLRDQDVRENWLTGVPLGNPDTAEFGGIGSGNLLSLNTMLYEQLLLSVENMRELRPMIADRLKYHDRAAFLSIPWSKWLSYAVQYLQGRKEDRPRMTVVQSRPWKLDIGEHVHLEIKSGWIVRVLQAFGLLLVAALPILKKILAACKVRPGQLFMRSILGLYVLIDLACLVMGWLLCAAAPVAHHLGAAFKVAASVVGPLATETVKHLERVPVKGKLLDRLSKALSAATSARVPLLVSMLMPKVKDEMLPAIAWDLDFFMELAAGSFVFLAASAVLAVVLCGAHWSAGVSAGVCGPLWLASEDAKNREGYVGRMGGLYLMIVSRSLFFAGIVVLKWNAVDSVDAFSVETYFALIFNRILSMTGKVTYWWTCWLYICAVHCLFGLAAAYAAKENLEESSEGATRFEVLTAEEYFQATYGTFDPTV